MSMINEMQTTEASYTMLPDERTYEITPSYPVRKSTNKPEVYSCNHNIYIYNMCLNRSTNIHTSLINFIWRDTNILFREKFFETYFVLEQELQINIPNSAIGKRDEHVDIESQRVSEK